jgi:hypothetical protein
MSPQMTVIAAQSIVPTSACDEVQSVCAEFFDTIARYDHRFQLLQGERLNQKRDNLS